MSQRTHTRTHTLLEHHLSLSLWYRKTNLPQKSNSSEKVLIPAHICTDIIAEVEIVCRELTIFH